MSEENDLAKADADAANSQLNEGLKSCRAVVNNYRALLTPEQGLRSATEEEGTGEQRPPPTAD